MATPIYGDAFQGSDDEMLPGLKDKLERGELRKVSGIANTIDDLSTEISEDVLNKRPSRNEISLE